MIYVRAFALAAALLMLGGCQVTDPGKPTITIKLPKAPQYYWQCFDALTPAAEKGKPLTRAQVVKLIGELSVSDKRKSKCGKDLLAWYATVRQGFATAK